MGGSARVRCHRRTMTKHGWILFVVIGALGVLMSISSSIDPSIMTSTFTRVGPPLPAGLDPNDPFIAFLVRWAATALIGVNAITIVIAATAFREGARWAGLAFLYWPLMFLSHLVMYRPGPMSVVQVVWIALSTAALVAHFRRTRPLTQPGAGDALAR